MDRLAGKAVTISKDTVVERERQEAGSFCWIAGVALDREKGRLNPNH